MSELTDSVHQARSRPDSGQHAILDDELGRKDFMALNEIAAQSPVVDTEDSDPHNLEAVRSVSRENRRLSSKASHGSSGRRSLALNEIAAPSPLEYKEEGRNSGQPDLEAVRSASQDERPMSHVGQTPKDCARREALLNRLFVVSHLILFSILGTLARLGLQALTFYPGAPTTMGVLWANFAGCVFMGFLSQDAKLFRPQSSPGKSSSEDEVESLSPSTITRAKKAVPLFIGLTTGFCGSFTSFSSFCRDAFLAISNDLPTPGVSSPFPRSRGDSVMSLFGVVIMTVALSVGGIKAGAHVALGAHSFLPTIPFRSMRRFFDSIVVFLAFGCWLGTVFMCIWPPDRTDSLETWRGKAILSLVFAPIGCLLRYYLSLKLNGVFVTFPLGTFGANVLGTIILGLAWDIQHARLPDSGLIGGGLLGCQALQGVQDGFCGCLTTVSTWALELTALRRWHAYIYGGSSVATGVSILILVMGSLRWTMGFDAKSC